MLKNEIKKNQFKKKTEKNQSQLMLTIKTHIVVIRSELTT